LLIGRTIIEHRYLRDNANGAGRGKPQNHSRRVVERIFNVRSKKHDDLHRVTIDRVRMKACVTARLG
jgi:hypothetical protein